VPSIYSLKPRFQALLRPGVRWLAHIGVTANQVTLAACLASVALGLYLVFDPRWLLLLPPFLFLRMALNAVDGMLAREFDQKSRLGAYLNEITDVVADSFLYLPFAFLPGFDPLWIGVVIVLAVISEMTGVVGVMVGANRRYDGPMGKSDRAFLFGAMALWIGSGFPFPPVVSSWFPVLVAFLLGVTIVNRVRKGLAEPGREAIRM
jgi:CDP-diacylglycerol--glycerol-3-phosphate 3-phosphatidyltransferase